MLRVISLGAGVQSTTMALMAAHGLIGPMPDYAIFADTGAEPQPVYDHLRWLMSPNVLPFPVHIVSAGNLRDDITQSLNTTGQRFASIPYFLDRNEQEAGAVGMGRRQCTKEYKLAPLGKAIRALLGYQPRKRIPRGSVECWIGISLDEKGRMKDARTLWQTNRWPLIEERMSRGDCLEWMLRFGYPRPPKSACTFCPYRDNAGWGAMKQNDPVSFADAVAVDHAIRAAQHKLKLRAVPYIHRSCKPLDQVDFTVGDPRQEAMTGFDYNECEGMCGL